MKYALTRVLSSLHRRYKVRVYLILSTELHRLISFLFTNDISVLLIAVRWPEGSDNRSNGQFLGNWPSVLQAKKKNLIAN